MAIAPWFEMGIGAAVTAYGVAAATLALVVAGVGLVAGGAARRWAPARTSLHAAATFVTIVSLLFLAAGSP